MKLDDRQILELLEVARRQGAVVMLHAENSDAITCLTERLLEVGKSAPRYHGLSRPSPVEREATHRTITLAEWVDVPIPLMHVPAAEAVAQIRWVRGNGAQCASRDLPAIPLSHPGRPGVAELPQRALRVQPATARQGQPTGDLGRPGRSAVQRVFIRSRAVQLRRRLGQASGRQGAGLPLHPDGVPGIETRMALLFSEGVRVGRMPIKQFVALTATHAARLYGRTHARARSPSAAMPTW